MKSIIAGLFLFIIPGILFAQDAKKKTEVIYIQTSAICGECKERIESAVTGLKGVKNAELNMKDKKLMVEYVSLKVSADDIKKTIIMAGYDADDAMADPTAYENLPKCCQKDSPEH